MPRSNHSINRQEGDLHRQKTSVRRPGMITRILVVLLVSLIHSSLGFAQTQPPKKVARIGYLIGSSPTGASTEAFRQRLRELGYVEGQNIVIEYRFARGNRFAFTSPRPL